jgi:hypothetical protein
MKKHTSTVMRAIHTTTFFLIQERRFFCAFLKHQTGHKDTKAPRRAAIKLLSLCDLATSWQNKVRHT